MGFSFNTGTFLLFLFGTMYLIAIIFFPFIKRNEVFGLREKKCFASEEIWHKIHVRASIATIPFALLNTFFIFVKNPITKLIVSFGIFIMVIITWSLIIRCTDKDYFRKKEQQEREELEKQKKKESGWR